MCTYNGALYLREQLDSLAAQTRLPDELVVCDDGSTDRTLAILDGFAAAAPFPVRIYRNPTRLGTPKNFERAIGLTTGAIIALADQDDVWYPHKLERLEGELARSKRIGLVFSDADVVDDRLRPAGYRLWEARRAVGRNRRLIARGRLFEALVRDNLVTGCTAAFRSDYKDLVIPVPAACAHCLERVRVAAVADVARIDAPLLAYRQHAANQCGLARYHGEKTATAADRGYPNPTAEKLLQAEGRLARLRAAQPPRAKPGPLSGRAIPAPAARRRHPARRTANRHSGRDQLGAAPADRVLGARDASLRPVLGGPAVAQGRTVRTSKFAMRSKHDF